MLIYTPYLTHVNAHTATHTHRGWVGGLGMEPNLRKPNFLPFTHTLPFTPAV